MLTVYFPEDLKTSKYEYLYLFIKKEILNSNLKANEKLPSKRQLAKHLNISVITVEAAYQQLMLEGFISSKPKSGFYVNELELNQNSKITTFEKSAEQKRSYEVDLLSNSIRNYQFPLSIWAKLNREILNEDPKSLLEKSASQGNEQLRKAIAKHLNEYMGMSVNYDQIVIGAGTEYLYNHVIQLTGKDKVYALENPGHKAISNIYNINGVKYLPLPLDTDGLDIKELRNSNASIVHISPAHHFPTGIAMSVKRRMEILKLVNERDGYVIEDDYDSEFRFDGKPVSSLYELDNNDRVIYINTFSKSLAPGFRIAYMILPKRLMDIFNEKLAVLSCTVSTMEQLILCRFINDGYFEKHINRTKNRYKKLRDKLISEIKNSNFYAKIKIEEADAGLHFLIKYPYQISDKEVIELADSINLKIAALSNYSFKEYNSHTLLINYTGLSIEDIGKAVNKLTQLFDLIERK